MNLNGLDYASSNAKARTLLALCDECDETGRATVRTIADRTGYSISQTHVALTHLADDGLVTGLHVPGGLRPLVKITARGGNHG